MKFFKYCILTVITLIGVKEYSEINNKKDELPCYRCSENYQEAQKMIYKAKVLNDSVENEITKKITNE